MSPDSDHQSNQQSNQQPGQPWSGPWADDARRLFDLLKVVAVQASAGLTDDPAASPGDAGPEHPPECRYCPLCQGMAVIRRAGPEVLERVSELAAGLAAGLREAESRPDATPGADAASGRPADSTSAPGQPPSTVRIDVTD